MNNIVDERLDTLRPLYTSHYLYSHKFDFNTEKYLISGLSFNATIDSADNQVNPYKGYFCNFNWRLNPEFLGSKYKANLSVLNGAVIMVYRSGIPGTCWLFG